ncbi:hypothetical protein RHSP_08793 [Rhizobium freirei PRF 81]|uniref:Uncharacterized protein n=1 Tax=Rhizobium freirei PRF 81 TaxID=363754 RepID=N6UY08_9HYPH|nr:hypothetical protein RHSP_08793 [Rhizobium freirei PRF 81]
MTRNLAANFRTIAESGQVACDACFAHTIAVEGVETIEWSGAGVRCGLGRMFEGPAHCRWILSSAEIVQRPAAPMMAKSLVVRQPLTSPMLNGVAIGRSPVIDKNHPLSRLGDQARASAAHTRVGDQP